MAKIYTKTITTGTDKTLILDPREGLIYPFDIGSDWTEARLGMFISMTPYDNDNATPLAETLTDSIPLNSFHIGLKNNDTTLPETDGALFWGATSVNPISIPATASEYINAAMWNMVSNGTTVFSPVSSTTSNIYISKTTSASADSYCAYIGQKFTITNRGGATQAVSVSFISPTTPKYSNSSLSVLRALLTSVAYGTNPIIATPWHDDGIPRAIPNAIFIRMPTSLNRLRIHSLMIERFA